MAMLGPADREEDRLAARRALYVILGLGIAVAVMVGLVAIYYSGYGY